MIDFIQKFLRKFGIQFKKFPDPHFKRRLLLMQTLNIDTVLDIGANTGQYMDELIKLGYKNRVISFEPLSSAFKILHERTLKAKNWSAHNYAFGNANEKLTINISANSQSSSLLDLLPTHVESAPESAYIGQEEIEVKKLDHVFGKLCNENQHVMLKIDTQGYEKNVLDGALETLPKIRLIQIEMSLIPLYENEMNYLKMIDFLDKLGFQLVSFEDIFSNPRTGQLLQVDGLFVNKTFVGQNNLIN